MRRGFTLIELMIVIAIIAIIAAIAIPNLLESRLVANEAAAAASLKASLFAAEVQFQGAAHQDADQDGTGEYAPIDCLNGNRATSKVPAGSLHLVTGVLASPTVNGMLGSYVSNGNYYFTSRVPSHTNILTQASLATWSEGPALAPGASGISIATATISAQNGERFFAIGCSPASYGLTGRQNFFLSQDGLIRIPPTQASNKIWLGATPANNVIPTAASIHLGMADAYGPKAKWPTAADRSAAPVYPVLNK